MFAWDYELLKAPDLIPTVAFYLKLLFPKTPLPLILKAGLDCYYWLLISFTWLFYLGCPIKLLNWDRDGTWEVETRLNKVLPYWFRSL
jgi:hypothetical protein